MRIALVSQEYPPETAGGGIGTQTYLKAHGLSDLDHDVTVISRAGDERRLEYRDGSVRVIRIAGQKLTPHTEIADWLSYSTAVAAEIAAVHRAGPLDVVEFPEWGCEAYVHLLNRTQWNTIPTILHLHGPLVMFAHTMGWPPLDSDFYRVGMQMEETCIRLADAVFSSSDCSADWCARHYGLDCTTTPRIHTGVDTQLFRPRGRTPAEPTIVFVGRIVENKGVMTLLEAACELAGELPGLRLRMLGDGETAVIETLRRRAAERHQEDLLDLPGFIPRPELPHHLSGAHVFAGPSVYEGGPGFVYLEAMACGLPVVAAEGSGASEVVIPGLNGLLIPPGDVTALRDALRSLLRDADLRGRLGAQAREYVLTEADSKKCLEALASFYAEVTQGNRCPRC